MARLGLLQRPLQHCGKQAAENVSACRARSFLFLSCVLHSSSGSSQSSALFLLLLAFFFLFWLVRRSFLLSFSLICFVFLYFYYLHPFLSLSLASKVDRSLASSSFFSLQSRSRRRHHQRQQLSSFAASAASKFSPLSLCVLSSITYPRLITLPACLAG